MNESDDLPVADCSHRYAPDRPLRTPRFRMQGKRRTKAQVRNGVLKTGIPERAQGCAQLVAKRGCGPIESVHYPAQWLICQYLISIWGESERIGDLGRVARGQLGGSIRREGAKAVGERRSERRRGRRPAASGRTPASNQTLASGRPPASDAGFPPPGSCRLGPSDVRLAPIMSGSPCASHLMPYSTNHLMFFIVSNLSRQL